MVNVDQHNVQCSCAVQHGAVLHESGTVHEKCRGWVHAAQSRNIGHFFGPSQSSIGSLQPFWGQFWRLPLFFHWLNRASKPLKPFFLRPTLSRPPFVLPAYQSLSLHQLRVHKVNQGHVDEIKVFCFNFGALNFLQGALCLFSQECSLHNSLS